MTPSSTGAKRHPVIKGTANQIADVLRSQIECGELPPGSTLVQAELAAQFGLSRIPVREALRTLEADGYIVYLPNKGATVALALPSSDLLEIVEMRECIESRLLDHALPRQSLDDVRRASETLEAIGRARRGDDVRGLHLHFHTLLLAPAGRPRMLETVNKWRLRYDEPGGAHLSDFLQRTVAVHKQLLHACKLHDGVAAQSALAREYDIFRAWLSEPD